MLASKIFLFSNDVVCFLNSRKLLKILAIFDIFPSVKYYFTSHLCHGFMKYAMFYTKIIPWPWVKFKVSWFWRKYTRGKAVGPDEKNIFTRRFLLFS